MRPHCAIYVDAGYLLAAAATRLTGTSYRSGIVIDHGLLLGTLSEAAEERSGLPLLRVHWYDAAKNGQPDAVQARIALLPRVKVRLGRMSYAGEQKGVDLRIGLDMLTHARSGAVDVMYLISGDDDLTEAVEEAQILGVQVVILAVPDSHGAPHAVSTNLQRAADDLELITAGDLDAAVHATAAAITASIAAASVNGGSLSAPADATVAVVPAVEPKPAPPLKVAVSAPPTPAAPTAKVAYSSSTGGGRQLSEEYQRDPAESEPIVRSVAERVLSAWLAGATDDDRAELARRRPSIPSEVDRTLLRDASSALGVYDLADPVRYQLRDCFWDAVDANVP